MTPPIRLLVATFNLVQLTLLTAFFGGLRTYPGRLDWLFPWIWHACVALLVISAILWVICVVLLAAGSRSSRLTRNDLRDG